MLALNKSLVGQPVIERASSSKPDKWNDFQMKEAAKRRLCLFSERWLDRSVATEMWKRGHDIMEPFPNTRRRTEIIPRGNVQLYASMDSHWRRPLQPETQIRSTQFEWVAISQYLTN